MQLTVKIVNVFDGNLADRSAEPSGADQPVRSDTGATSCVMDGTYITGIRTAASAVLSARLLSRAGCRVATVIGAGVQGREHLRLLPLIRELDHINVCSLRFDDAGGWRPAALARATRRRGDRGSRVGHRVPGDSLALAGHRANG